MELAAAFAQAWMEVGRSEGRVSLRMLCMLHVMNGSRSGMQLAAAFAQVWMQVGAVWHGVCPL
jgi:hypothetical protein